MMADREERTGLSPEAAGEAEASSAAAPAQRVLLLECRLEQLLSSLSEARADADLARTRLAEAAAREADHARRHALVQEELAVAREEVASLHRRLERSDALRAEMEGRLFEAGSADAGELVRLRREASGTLGERDAHRQAMAHLRARIDELVASREVLFTRVVEWQRLVRQGDPEAMDLGEFIAALRRDILDLEHQNVLGERREAELRRRLLDAGAAPEGEAAAPEPATDAPESTTRTPEAAADASEAAADAPHADGPVRPPEPECAPDDVPAADARVESVVAGPPPAEETGTAPGGGRAHDLVAALTAAHDTEGRIDLLLRLGRCGEDEAFYAVRPWASSTHPGERAAAYQALGRLLERDPSRLEPYVRWGIADHDPHVRRRVILAAATARGLAVRPLLEPLRADPDAQVRRVVNEVLRRPSTHTSLGEGDPVPARAERRVGQSPSGVAS